MKQEDKLTEKLSMIWEGWTTKPKTDEPWFQERFKHCSGCIYNSENKELNFKEKILRKTLGPYCTACGCPFARKLTVKRSTCGLKDLGLEPLWGPIEIEGGEALKNTSIEAVDGSEYTMGRNERGYTLHFGKTSKDKLDFSFIFFAPIQYKFITVKTNCGCTIPKVEDLGDGRYLFNIELSTLSFNKGFPSSRIVEIRFDNGLEVPVTFIVEKQ